VCMLPLRIDLGAVQKATKAWLLSDAVWLLSFPAKGVLTHAIMDESFDPIWPQSLLRSSEVFCHLCCDVAIAAWR
jgi:hypothetical protein